MVDVPSDGVGKSFIIHSLKGAELYSKKEPPRRNAPSLEACTNPTVLGSNLGKVISQQSQSFPSTISLYHSFLSRQAQEQSHHLD